MSTISHRVGHDHAHEHAHGEAGGHGHAHPLGRTELARIALVGAAAVAVWLRVFEPFERVSVLGLAAALVGGYPIFRHAAHDVARRRMTMELSMTIALAAALAIGEFLTALVIVFFVLVAEVLEGLTVGRGRTAIGELLDRLPRTAHVRRGEAVAEIPAADLRAGDVVVVRPGSAIPVDGTVVAGHSFVDQASITGESLPVEKLPGAAVHAGTINQSGALEVRTVGLGRDTAYGRILDAVERAEHARAPIQKTADRLAGWLVWFALACAALTFLVTRDARSTISVIIVAGACGVAAGTPLAILGAIGRAARDGAIVKGGIHLEALWGVDTVVLDKTGTLTYGNPEVARLLPADGVPGDELLRVAATAERPSEHPLGRAIVRLATARRAELADPEAFAYTPGRGVRCLQRGAEVLVGSRAFLAEHGVAAPGLEGEGAGGTLVFVARGGAFLGALAIADTLRPEAPQAVRELRDMGLRTVLLTGDRKAIAESVGAGLGVDEIGAEMLPQGKLDRVRALLAEGRRVAMVGDGVNDAPALMTATVGIAMGSGTDVARESASVLLLGNDLLRLAGTVRLARWCRRIIRTNFAGTLAVDAVGVGLAAFGLLNPMFAALLHVSSELAFILNSARLLPR